ncbi:MAG: hypothetical protein JW871_03275 [Endomicrobiales bacterium]|nr:hypothetical protein [Endomicrobiales bacterium]
MKTFNRVLLRYLIFAFPLVLGLVIWGGFVDLADLSLSSGFIHTLWDIGGINLMVWVCSLLYLIAAMTVSENMRNDMLARIAGIKERDERESLIAGTASRSVFLLTTSILILLLFLSLITVKIGKKPADAVAPGEKRGYISLGLQFSTTQTQRKDEPSGRDQVFFDYKGIPISNSGLLLFLLLCQIGFYHYSARRSPLLK